MHCHRLPWEVAESPPVPGGIQEIHRCGTEGHGWWYGGDGLAVGLGDL